MFRKKNLLSEAEISYFCQQINMIIKAGLPTYYGISILKDSTKDENTKEFLAKMYEKLESGDSLYDTLSSVGIFPAYMLQMINIGEQTGRLEDVLDALIRYYDRAAEIKASIKHAITYPLIMSVMMLAVIIVIITTVVPIFADVYAELGSSLTGIAKVLMNISYFLNRYLLLFIVIFIMIAILIFILIQTPWAKKIISNLKFARSVATSRFANCMYLALASGLDTNQGLELAEILVENSYMEKRIQQCKDYIQKGESFSNALLLSGCFSEMYASLINIGYKTSAMDDVMLRISEEYEKETDHTLRHFIAILEPSLIIILSFFIGLILVSFLLPLLGIMSSIG